MSHLAESSPLGKSSEYVSQYTPALLFPIARAPKWAELGLCAQSLPYYGVDIWTGYELSWLLPSGKPIVAVGEFIFPADSPCIIESKSFKLYLNSLNQSVFADLSSVENTLAQDLSRAAGASVTVRIRSLVEIQQQGISSLPGRCIDELEVNIAQYSAPNAQLLACDAGPFVEESLHSHLLKSNCPVTGQPDWASIGIEYRGPRLQPASLLAYLVSFRQHADFHEQCVERIFLDVQQLLRPERLTVYARYVRRGGLDINPFRSTEKTLPADLRLARQ